MPSTPSDSPPAEFRLRDATAEDAERLAEFGARTFREAFGADNDPEDLRRHLESSFNRETQSREIRDPGTATLLLESPRGEWLAFAQLREAPAPEGVPEGSLELWRFYVDRAWHGRGVAHTLMDAAKARARQRGATRLWLGVWERNQRAQAFYRKHGFHKVGSKLFVVGGDPQTDDVLLCELA